MRTSLALILSLWLGACARPAGLDVPAAPALAPPAASPPAEMRIAAIVSGYSYARAAFAYEGGPLGEERAFSMGGVLVRRPKGDLLFDAGFGPGIAEHFRIATPWLMRRASRIERRATVADQLRKAGLEPSTLTAVVLTHAHWDHVSGLEAMPGTPVWVSGAELAYVKSGDPSSKLARRLGTGTYKAYDFPDGPYLGFPRSRDVFGDGSVVIVPAPGSYARIDHRLPGLAGRQALRADRGHRLAGGRRRPAG